MIATEDLPMADEVTETPTDLRTVAKAFLDKPNTVTTCALLDLLEESGRSDDAEKVRQGLQLFCSSAKSRPQYAKDHLDLLRHSVELTLWFDLYGLTTSLDAAFDAVKKSQSRSGGMTSMTASAVSFGITNAHGFGGTNASGG